MNKIDQKIEKLKDKICDLEDLKNKKKIKIARIKNKYTGIFETSYKKQSNGTEKMELKHISQIDTILDPTHVISKLTVNKKFDTEFVFEKKWKSAKNKTIKFDCVEAEELYILLHDYYRNTKDTYKYIKVN